MNLMLSRVENEKSFITSDQAFHQHNNAFIVFYSFSAWTDNAESCYGNNAA